MSSYSKIASSHSSLFSFKGQSREKTISISQLPNIREKYRRYCLNNGNLDIFSSLPPQTGVDESLDQFEESELCRRPCECWLDD
ncbi:MAG: hypothetical protein EZS28_022429 [Streblomastix strix]|uniref:Uncharacterized protein n=1 Tax=Streblomastix strix TaxID=222440 RepID=A0A5J4VHQ6_9EUKA|nr:MAG: hypothetical protein EZS28_022429 [Streblomastix strix]